MRFQNEYVETKSLYFEKYGTPQVIIKGVLIWLLAAAGAAWWYRANVLAIIFLSLALFQCVRNASQIGGRKKSYNELVERVGEGRKVKTSFFKDRVVVEADGDVKKTYNCKDLLGFRERKNVISLYFEKGGNEKANNNGKNEISFLKDDGVDIVCIKKDGFTIGDVNGCKEFLKEARNTDLFFA